MTQERPDLGDLLDEVYPALFARLDVAFPEFGWRRAGEHWVATLWPASLAGLANEHRPDRLMVYADRPHWVKVHGHEGVRFLDLVAGGRKPSGEDFPRAVRELCRLSGVPFPDASPEEQARLLELEARRDALEATVELCELELWGSRGEAARAFLLERGFSERTARELHLGLYLSTRDVREGLRARAIDLEAARSAGALRAELEGYVIIPWNDAAGRPLTLYGRWATKTPPAGLPKTTALPGAGTKGIPLYLDRARRAKHDELVLVEGLFDAAQLQAHGETRAVASVAAQLSGYQVDALKRYQIRAVTIVGDPDGGGDKGTIANIKTLAAAGIATYVPPRLPDELDPDEFLLERGLDGWRALLARAVPGVVFRAQQELGEVTPASLEKEKRDAIARVARLVTIDLKGAWSELDRASVVRVAAAATGFKEEDVEQALRAPLELAEESVTNYLARDGGLIYLKPTQHGTVPVPLTNFTAKITADVLEDDGQETKRTFELEARLKGKRHALSVQAPEFPALGWVADRLGSKAIIYPGSTTKDHARCAIQQLSGDPAEKRVFVHTGWRKLGDRWIYLHAGGAVGELGPAEGAEVRLDGTLGAFSLPAPPEGKELVRAIRASLGLLELAPPRVTTALLGAVYRAPLGPCDLSVFLVGRSGAFKSQLAALAQQHWGSALDATHLPGSWSSTGNALEGLAFLAKDALFVVDDFAPSGSSSDVARMHREADRLLRAQGNGAGRQRMRADTSIRAPRPPRGLILSTGEDVPAGFSLRARLAVLELEKDAVDVARLTRAQVDAREGLLARALAGYLRWLAPRVEGLRKGLELEAAGLRADASREGEHRRTPAIVGQLAIGWRYWLAYALESGAIDAAERERLWQEAWRSLLELGAAQGRHQESAEPAARFLALLGGALTAGRAHVATTEGDAPPRGTAGRWGWRFQEAIGVLSDGTWRASGDRVGWLSGDNLYLDPEAAYACARRFGEGTDGLTVSLATVKKRLRERGSLASVDTHGDHATIKVRGLEGARRRVLHLLASTLLAEGEPEGGPVGGPDGPAVTIDNGATLPMEEEGLPAKGPDGPAIRGERDLYSQEGGPGPESVGFKASKTSAGSEPLYPPGAGPSGPPKSTHAGVTGYVAPLVQVGTGPPGPPAGPPPRGRGFVEDPDDAERQGW